MSETVYILLGSNIGDRERNLSRAMDLIENVEGLELIATSSIYVTAPVDMVGENPSFLNQVVMVDYAYSPNELLSTLEALEDKLGRTDKGQMRPRSIDLDILLFGDQTIATDRLTVPHAKLLKRPFAMIPLVEISPEITHPSSGRRIAQYIKKADHAEVILYKDHVARSV